MQLQQKLTPDFASAAPRAPGNANNVTTAFDRVAPKNIVISSDRIHNMNFGD